LVDCLLKQSGPFGPTARVAGGTPHGLDGFGTRKGHYDSRQERRFKYKNYHINIVDTPGHADFGGEVERIMNMIDGVLLVVDSVDGPQAQTRFVLRKALEAGAKPIVVINKIDRDNAQPHKVLDAIFELFESLHATDEQLDFPVIYASAKGGYAKEQLDPRQRHDGTALRCHHQAYPAAARPRRRRLQAARGQSGLFRLPGRIALGKIVCGKVKVSDPAVCIHGDGRRTQSKVTAIYHFEGMKRIEFPKPTRGHHWD